MPSARRLSQTLGPASSLVMKARRPFIAPIALSCEAQVAAGVSKSARLPKVASQGRRGLSVLRRPAHGRINPNPIELGSAFKRFSRSIEKQATSRLSCSSLESLVFLASSIHRFNSSRSWASGTSSVGMLRHRKPSKVAPPRAWPNPSFKRTRLRRSA